MLERDLIANLSREHEQLMLLAMGLANPTLDFERRWHDLKAFQIAVYTHLEKEDSELYPALARTGTNHALEHEDHRQVTRFAREFFAWWPTVETILTPEFQPALEAFTADLVARMKFEEQVIFPAYSRHPVA